MATDTWSELRGAYFGESAAIASVLSSGQMLRGTYAADVESLKKRNLREWNNMRVIAVARAYWRHAEATGLPTDDVDPMEATALLVSGWDY